MSIKASTFDFLASAATDPDAAAAGEGALREYLKRFGYWHRKSALNEGDAMAAALRRYQRFQRLPVTGMFDGATTAAMTRPRCGVPDLFRNRTFGLEMAVRWPGPNITYGVVNHSAKLGAVDTSAALTMAADIWDAALPTITLFAAGGPPDLPVSFVTGDHGDVEPFDGPGHVLAHAFPPPPHSLQGQMHVDDEDNWSVDVPTPQGAFDLVTQLAHEIGHALGLDHSDDPAEIMYPSYTGVHRFLAPGDVSAIRAIYG